MMLELTQTTANALKRAIGRDQSEAKGVRTALAPSGFPELRFKLDLASAAREGESICETDGAIFVNRSAIDLIKGTRIDYAESLEGGSFIFQNPNAESTCVCGRSTGAAYPLRRCGGAVHGTRRDLKLGPVIARPALAKERNCNPIQRP
jgi:iron-sulfur cluster assembly protein